MPEFIRNFQFTPLNILKAAGVILIGLVLLAFALSIVSGVMGTVRGGMPGGFGMGGGGMGLRAMPGMSEPMYDDYAEDSYYGESDASYGVELSARNVTQMSYPGLPPIYPPIPGGTTGNTAEQFEVTEYSASIETTDKEESCLRVSKFKELEYVIFESANEYDEGCNFTFKVEHAHVDEILGFVKEMDPKDLSENTYTIQNQIDDFTSEEAVLAKKRASIDETLKSALLAYDEITRLATANQNADALAKIIDNKIQLIERLTEERININEQLDRLTRAKAEQLDRLDYTYFHLNIVEYKYVDGEIMRDSWKASVGIAIYDTDIILQQMTLGLIPLFFLAIQYIIYLLLLVVIAKYLWRVVRYIWEKP